MGAHPPARTAKLPLVDQALWRRSQHQHETYKKTQDEDADIAGQMNPIGNLLNKDKASAQQRVELCSVLDKPPEAVAIRQSAKRHLKNGVEVFADILGWPRPPKINGHIPDVYAYYPDGREVVQEFENDRSVFSSHARRQDVAFSLHATEFEQVEYEQVVIRGGRGGRR